MMMMLFNHLALRDRQPLPAVTARDCDALWVTSPETKISTPALFAQHLHTQRGMEAKTQEMRERGDNIALKSRITYHRNPDGRSGSIRFDY